MSRHIPQRTSMQCAAASPRLMRASLTSLAIIACISFSRALPPRPSFASFSARRAFRDGAEEGGSQRTLTRPFATVSTKYLRKDLISQCVEHWRNATTDHYSWGTPPEGLTTFRQRYFVCDRHWQKRTCDGLPGPIFFYLGNEADVTLYLNNTGLMWESAPDFGAMLVFAEHRYYGKSLPYGKNVRKHMAYLGAEQAMADYAELIAEIKVAYGAQDSAVIGFGGSYGGMLAAWMRLKYPHALDGAIAASAPIWNFMGQTPAFDPGSFAKGVTYDASEQAGSAKECISNVRGVWELLLLHGGTDQGRSFLSRSLRLCPTVPLEGERDVLLLREWLAAAFDYMAMGNFPYPSAYITNGHGELPAFPVRAACAHLAADGDSVTDEELLDAMSQAVGVFYNHTGDLPCFDPFGGTDPDSDADADFWDLQWCAEMTMPFSKDGVDDMFWSDPFDLAASVAACRQRWGVTPRPLWATTQWGGRRITAGSNIVFSNGLLDPWHGGGVLEDISDSMPAVIIPEGAHHLDLMFSHPDDPLSVRRVRDFQREAMRDWVRQAARERGVQPAQAAGAGSSARGGPSRESQQGRQEQGGCALCRAWRAVRVAVGDAWEWAGRAW